MQNKPKETRSAGGVVINRHRKVLIVGQKGKSWSFPKGHIEEGEDPITAATREIHEESGITDLELIEELGSYQRYKIDERGGEDKSELKTIIMFLFRTNQDSLKPVDPENPEAKWVEISEITDLLTHSKDKEFFLRTVQKVQRLS